MPDDGRWPNGGPWCVNCNGVGSVPVVRMEEFRSMGGRAERVPVPGSERCGECDGTGRARPCGLPWRKGGEGG